MFDLISFLTDFGTADTYVGQCHGVLAADAPGARVVDLSHAVDPGDIAQGAAMLARAVPYLPVGVHLAVVDPGVGTARRGIAVGSVRGDVLVGPDNGLLLPAVEALDGLAGVWELHDPRFRRLPTSSTFHGRDVFSPAAAAVARGVPPEELGPPVTDLVALDRAAVTVDLDGGRLVTPVELVDRYGNLQLAARATALDQLGVGAGSLVVFEVGAREVDARRVRTFGELDAGGLGVHTDSDGRLAIAVNGGSAAARLGATRGTVVAITVGRRGSPDDTVTQSHT